MTSIEYGGIVFTVIKTLAYKRQPIWDGPNYLYTRHKFHVRGVLNPLATSYDWGGGPALLGITPPVAPVNAPITDGWIRQQLAKERQQLIVRNGDTIVLQSPRPGFPVDCSFGPFPSTYDVVYCGGIKTYLIEFAVETDIDESYLYGDTKLGPSPPRTMLSHLWSITDGMTLDYFTTRTIRGHAIFNAEQLVTLGANADDFRYYLFHATPNGMRRDQIEVNITEDGTTCEYTIVDREVYAPLTTNRFISRIEATHRVSLDRTDPVLAEIQKIFGAALTAGGAVGARPGHDVASGVRAAAMATYQNMPKLTHHIHVKVFGNNNASRDTLRAVAVRIMVRRLSDSPIGSLAFMKKSGMHVSLLDDIMGSYSELDAVWQAGPILTVDVGGSGVAWPMMWGSDSVPPYTTTNQVVSGIGPPNDERSRGTFISSMIVQALRNDFQTTPSPALSTPRPNTPYTNRTP